MSYKTKYTVFQIDTRDHDVLDSFETIVQASETTGVRPANIGRAIKNRK